MESNQLYLNHVFHADLSDRFEGEEYWLQAGKNIPGWSMTKTAFVLPSARIPVYNPPLVEGSPIILKALYQDSWAVFLCISVRHTNNTGCVPGDYGVHHATIHIVKDHEANRALALNEQVVFADHIDYVTTAKTLLFHHADIISQDPDTADIVMEHMDQFKAPSTYLLIQDLATKMRAGSTNSKFRMGYLSGF